MWFLFLSLFFWPEACPAAQENHGQKKVRAYRMEAPPKVDGLVHETAWRQMEPATGFIQQEPHEGEPASEQTEVRIGYDDDNLYIGIVCRDSKPGNVVVTQNRRDAPLNETDAVVILLDTFNDDQNAFLFGTSPTGIEYDGQVSKAGQGRGGRGTPARAGGQGGQAAAGPGGGAVGVGGGGAQRGGASAFNLNWDGVWKVRSQITSRGWESEMVIPFKTLRYVAGRETMWGLNVWRNLRRRNEQSFWSPVRRPFTISKVELAGNLVELELKAHRNLKLIPYVLGGLKQDYALARGSSRAAHDAGLDLKYSLTPGLTLDATFNTDFAQVEVDQEQINLTRFDLFFPEKRPFFLENSGTFEVGAAREVEIFFSRRIGIDDSGTQIPIDAGLRLSGKLGRYALGVLNMQTRRVEGVAPANNFSVVRLSREFANRSSLGVIGVQRQATTSFPGRRPHNRTFGADANIGLGRYANWFNYFAQSLSPGLRGQNHAASSALEYDNEHHRMELGYTEVGHHFNPEVGFVRRAGYRKPMFGYRYTHYPASRRLRSVFPHFQWNRWYTLGRNDKESGFEHYHVDTRWQNGSSLGIAWNRNFERLDAPFEVFPGVGIKPGRYSFSEVVFNYGSDQSAPFFALGNVSLGRFYGGTIRTVNFNGGYRRGQSITWTGSYIRNFINLPEGAFTTDLIGLRFNWSFTPRSYLQSFTQYNSQSNQVAANIRLAFLSTSNTGFFLVYNTRVATVDYLDPHGAERRTLSRALLVKFNYLFDF